MTTLEEERAEQRRWSARMRRADSAPDLLLANEFQAADAHDAQTQKLLAEMLRFAARWVPYYKERFRRLGIDPLDGDPLASLAALPVLSKLDVHQNEAALHATRLPRGETAVINKSTSGTTGRPTRIRHSLNTSRIFSLLKQREYRWFRFDPAGTLAMIRLPSQLPRHPDGRELADGETQMLAGWINIDADFNTGPFLGFAVTNPPDVQLDWLRRHGPDYLLSYSESLEHLAFTAGGEKPFANLKGLVAISEQMTPTMRAHIERSFGAKVHQNYGLNEVGVVAGRCEEGRYHVHNEHCHVEILASDGRTCAPGEIGRLIVTTLKNWAMPLLRYDTDDLAQAARGPCPCGRTLPSFADVVGRYSRIAYLPEGTLGLVGAFRGAIESLPPELVRALRQFQIHQHRDGSFELRLVASAPLPADVTERLRAAWQRLSVRPEQVLAIRQVQQIARSPGGKFQVFTSDFMPRFEPSPVS
jgi:phenylacetate-CoA ligase